MTVPEARTLLDPLGIPWWIASGVALEAFHGVPRRHGDLDVGVFRRDLPILRAGLSTRFHLWSAGSGMIRPLTDETPDPHPESDQIWLREHALAPWRVDVLLNPDRDGAWVFRREPSFAAPLDAVTWPADGVRYLRPEIVLAFKAKQTRPKDDVDFAATLPRLDDGAAAWLEAFLERTAPHHPWRERLRSR
jgi:hypothetical protein